MATADIPLPWGGIRHEGGAPHTLVEEGLNYVVYKRATDTPFALAWTGEKTVYKIQRDKDLDAIVSWAREQAGAGAPPAPPIPPVEEKAYFRIDSEPSGGRVWIDNVDTGFYTWTPTIEVSPGYHKIEVAGIEGFADTQTRRLAKAGETINVQVPMSKFPPPAPPPEEPREPSPREEFKTPFTALVTALLGEEPGWAKAWDDVMFWLTDTFGTEFPTFYKDELTGEIKKMETGKKLLFLVSMKAPVTVGGKALQKALVDMTASELRSLATKNPAKLKAMYRAIPQASSDDLFARLDMTAAGRKAIEALQKVVLPAGFWTLKKKLGLGAIGALGFVIYALTFESQPVIETLRRQKILPDEQADLMTELAFAGKDVVKRLETIKFSCVKEDFDATLERVAATSAKWDELIAYTEANLLTGEQLADLGEILAYRLAVVPPKTTDALLQAVKDARKAFEYSAQTEINAINERCAWRPDEAEDKLYGTIILNTEPADVLLRVAGEEKRHATGEEIKLIAGSHDIVIEAEGFQSRRKAVISKAGITETVSFILEKIPEEIEAKAGRLQILVYDDQTSAPITATLIIDGRAEAFPGHQHVLDMKPDTYEIRLEKAGYDFYTDTIAIDEGKTTALTVRLKRPPAIEPPLEPDLPPEVEPGEPEKGFLEANANVKADIAIGGVDTGETTPHRFELTQGFYTVKLSAEGYGSRATTTLVKTGEPTVVFLELFAEEEPAIKVKLARVSLQSEPVGAKILVNGVFAKQYTPDSVLLLPGDYEISLAKTGYKTWSTPLRLAEET